ncbi:hybrid sensor histidine kinase/response regulator [Mucilaginibacter pedocola]|uniref:Response regulatory domain-containing protein n=1 Tax=Mucilaginibacter pedocola TaxID=1792845 RepID=A0A1S9P6Y0_9SPHI|nr:response regulator [Mucilaginibacter pedocola]OOQ56699.1 hypothetical protein BC343_17025 [Mucilaginibacter pedocola]
MQAAPIKNILVVEDNPGDFLLTEEFLLEQLQFPNIVQAKSSQEAKQLLTAQPLAFDVILLDLSLPDSKGEELINEMMSVSSGTPVIVLTGYTDLTFGVKSLALGVADYILKEELTAISLHKSIVYSIERKKVSAALEASERTARNFAQRLNNVLEDERARIARELHDEFGQQLSGLKMSLSALKKSYEIPSPTIDGIIADVDNGIQTLRKIANELRPAMLDKFGLFAAIEWLVTDLKKKTGIKTGLYIDARQPELDSATETNIFRICQEALTNVVKHANASFTDVQVENIAGELFIRITDNGIGLRPDNAGNPLSMGLMNMQERARLINASITIRPGAQGGTTVELIVNLNGNKNINS